MDDKVVGLVLPAMFGFGGLFMAALSVMAFRKTQRWRTEGATVEGEVVDFVERELPPRENLDEIDDRVQKFCPVLTYTAADGKSYRCTASAAEPQGAYTIGQRLPVRYLTTSPTQADLEKMAISNIPGIAFAILSFLAVSVAIIVFSAS